MVPALPPARHRHPGEPGLSTPHRLPLVSGGHTRWLAEVLAALDIPRAAFVGTSLGRRTFGWLPKALLCSAQGEAGRRKLFHLVTGWSGITPEIEEYQLFVNRHFRPRQDRITVATDEELARLRVPVLAFLRAVTATSAPADLG
ncbi:hypothetical protein N8J89_21315 [Crossiella sp. CA-258035]|uniref:hypothetical protein n=1 Tax=Crossiella sp. CA-258035 TaxID=2981138 RepID=UPI0024BC8AD1|nr:hypothetical protein [Crossiella sp. CA-258035]WHT15682.1 hypothetical protein N8J89_21315 [Crossiella sp. CA-258035]